jgi:acyl-CoA thioester hydrolase
MTRLAAHQRSDYLHFQSLNTRWGDNDAYGHVNNVLYYSWFDTAVNAFLINNTVLDIAHSPVIGLVIESHCNYFAPVSFPERVTIGLRVARMGRSSVCYEVAVFRDDAAQAAAQGHFVHVYVDRASRRPAAIPEAMRTLLATIVHPVTSVSQS